MTTQNTQHIMTVANELSRAELMQILTELNATSNCFAPSGHISKMSTKAMISQFAKHEDVCIEIGASMGIGACLIEPEQEPTVATKPGVVAAIIDFVRESKGNQFVLGDILTVLVKKFPDRDPNGLMRTIRTQVPHRLSKERGFKFVRELGMLRCLSCK